MTGQLKPPTLQKSGQNLAASFDHLIGAQQERSDRQAEGLGRLEVDDELVFGGLLHRKFAWARAFSILSASAALRW